MPGENDCTECFPDPLSDMVDFFKAIESKACEFVEYKEEKVERFTSTILKPFVDVVQSAATAWNKLMTILPKVLDLFDPFQLVVNKINVIINYEVSLMQQQQQNVFKTACMHMRARLHALGRA